MAKLGEVFTLQMGKTPARAREDYWNTGDNAWVSISDISACGKYVGKTETDFIRDQIIANANVSTVGTYTITNANNTTALVPPVDEQLKYVEFCRQTGQIKTLQ